MGLLRNCIYFNTNAVRVWCASQKISYLWLSGALGKTKSYIGNALQREAIDPEVLQRVSELSGIDLKLLKENGMQYDVAYRKLVQSGVIEKGTIIDLNNLEQEYNETLVSREEFLAHAGEADREAKAKMNASDVEDKMEKTQEEPAYIRKEIEKKDSLSDEIVRLLLDSFANGIYTVSVTDILKFVEQYKVVHNG